MTIDQARQASGVTSVLERPGARLVYEVAGDGPAVVLVDQAVVIGSPATDLLAETAGRLGVWLSVGVDERDERDERD